MVILNDINRYTTYVQHNVRYDVSFEEEPSLNEIKFNRKGIWNWILLKVNPAYRKLS